MNITIEDKLRCVVRELRQRQRCYPQQVALGKISQPEANREIAVMECVALDYRAASRGLGTDLSDLE
jgi:hypothetical protein